MNIQNYTPEYRRKLLLAIPTLFHIAVEVDEDMEDSEMVDSLLEALIPVLDQWDGHDAWGSEGWKHAAGVAE